MIRQLLRAGIPTLSRLRCSLEPLKTQFDQLACSSLQASSILLDAGCGNVCRVSAQGKCKLVIGIDEEYPSSTTKGLDVRVIGDLAHLPFKKDSFDVITCFMVVEHLEKPEACFEEFNRVCKSKGTVIIATPNLWHYSTLVVKLTPYWFHEWFVRVIISGSGGSFPTRYKANTPGRLGRGMELAGFQQIEMRLLDFGPPYLDWFTLGYALGLVWHRLINQFSKFAFLRETLLGIFQKP